MYRVYLGKVLLPITPSKITTKIQNNNETINLMNYGEVNVLKQAKLTEIEFDFLLPVNTVSTDMANTNPRSIAWYLENLEKKKQSKKAFVFKVLRPNEYDTNLKVSLEDYTITEDADEGNYKKVSIKLKQFVKYGLKKIKTETQEAVTEAEQSEGSPIPTTQTTYTVQSGDCLYEISKRFYGDGSLYDKLYEANKDLIDKRNKGTSNPKYTIYTGQKLIIPSLDEAKKIQTKAKAKIPSNQSEQSIKASGRKYKVVNGDTIYSISNKFYKNEYDYIKIYAANQELIDVSNAEYLGKHNRIDYTHQWTINNLPQGKFTLQVGIILTIP